MNQTELLQQLQQKAQRRKLLACSLEELQAQAAAAHHRTLECKAVLELEQADVDKLQRGGMSAFLFKTFGKMEEKLDKEQLEVRQAESQMADALRAAEEAQVRLQRAQEELESLCDAETQYISALEQAITAAASEEERTTLKKRLLDQLETSKADVQAVQCALDAAWQALEHAGSFRARSMSGGNTVGSIAKIQALDDAQQAMEALARVLRGCGILWTEGKREAPASITESDGSVFADVTAGNRLGEAKTYVRQLRAQAGETLAKLEQQADNARKETL